MPSRDDLRKVVRCRHGYVEQHCDHWPDGGQLHGQWSQCPSASWCVDIDWDDPDDPEAFRVSDTEVWEMMLFEDCETCEGRGWNIFDSGWAGFECEDCTDGRVLREGVERYVQCCDECHEANPRYVVSVELIEGGTDE